MTTIPNIETTLNSLDIEYRKINIKDGVIYFCFSLNTDTFNLFAKNDGTIKLWRFVGIAPLEKAITKWEYRRSNNPYMAIGLEITDEGDVDLYAEEFIDMNAPEKDHLIRKLITGYSNIISEANFTNIKM
jgi:hypothetical protein